MSDRIPGSSWDNPIWHRKWRIYTNDFDAHPSAWMVAFVCTHDDYDGAPDAGDDRCFHGPTVEDCKRQADEYDTDQHYAAMIEEASEHEVGVEDEIADRLWEDRRERAA